MEHRVIIIFRSENAFNTIQNEVDIQPFRGFMFTCGIRPSGRSNILCLCSSGGLVYRKSELIPQYFEIRIPHDLKIGFSLTVQSYTKNRQTDILISVLQSPPVGKVI